MTEKGVTIERSPSGLGIGVFSPHLGGGGSAAWEQQQSTIITKLAQTPSNRIQTTENLDKERRTIRKVDEKNNVNRSCGCGGWARAAQLEHDLAELTLTHQNLLVGLHLQVDSLKQKNRDLTFQLLMGPTAAQVQPDFPFSPESDEATSPKNELQMKIDKTSKKREDTSAKNVVTTSTDSTTTSNTTTITTTISDTIKAPLRLEAPPGSLTTTTKTPPESLLNGDIVVRRSLPGRTGRGDPRLVRSLDLELLEEEAHNTRRMLEEERAKNMYLTSLVEDLKRMLLEDDNPPPAPPPTDDEVGAKEQSPRSQQIDKLLSSTSPVQRRATPDLGKTQAQTDREPRFPPLGQQYQQTQQERGGRPPPRKTGSPTNRRFSERSSEREGGTTLPAISSGARSDQKPHELQQQRGRGRYFGRGRTRNRQQQQQQQPQQQQDRQQRQDISETEVGLHPSRGSGRAPTAREDSRGRRDPARTPTSSRDLSQGQRGGGHGRDGSVGATSSPQAEIKRGAAAQEQDPRPEIRAKGRGRAHRRGGRGRLRKEKHNASSEQPESEQ
ncbi:uncharacterized protein [Cherax quadricarinatus]|uniref:uncharacterized protein isoform X2 n=1 Tax=Cherax quadricarinatus TaxID=27406 RepID=UPI00387EA117